VSEEAFRQLVEIKALQYAVQRLYLFEYARTGVSLDEARAIHRGLVDHIDEQQFGVDDPARSMLLAGALQHALHELLAGVEKMLADAYQKAPPKHD
jgi:enoyl-CoA hydratase/carnithine racemase